MAIMDETEHFGARRKNDEISESIGTDSVDSFDEYIGSKFGTSMVKSGPGVSKSNMGISKSLVTEIIGRLNIMKE